MGFFGLLVWVGQIIWIKRKHRAMILLAAVLVMITFMFTHSGYFERAFDIDQQKADISRINLWKQAFELIKIKPLFGVGPGAFVKAKTFFNIEGDKIHVTHNSFLAVGAENGVLALIMYLLLPILSIRDLFFGERGFVGNHGLRSICQAVRTGIITLCFSMFFLSQQFNHFFWVFLGMSVVLKKLSYNHRQSMNISIPENTENQVRSIVQN
jgi:O-antigen ligase